MSVFITPLVQLMQKIEKYTPQLGLKALQNPDSIGCASVDFLRILGYATFAYLFAQMAYVAQQRLKVSPTDAFYRAKLQTAHFFFSKLLPQTDSLFLTMNADASCIMDTDDALTAHLYE